MGVTVVVVVAGRAVAIVVVGVVVDVQLSQRTGHNVINGPT